MTAEIRQILFRKAEVAQAVRAYRLRISSSWPPGVVVDTRYDRNEGEGWRCTIRVQDGQGSSVSNKELVIPYNELAASLILFCRETRIPLPAQAEKSLHCYGEQLCLIVTRNPKGEAIPQAMLRN